MSLIELDLLQSAEGLLQELKLKHPRASFFEAWLDWSKQKIPSYPSPLLDASLGDEERWERVFVDVAAELARYEKKEISKLDLSWLALFELSLKKYKEEKYVEAQKNISMAIQKQPRATRLLRVLGWILHQTGSDADGVWQLYMQNEPNGHPALEVQEKAK